MFVTVVENRMLNSLLAIINNDEHPLHHILGGGEIDKVG